MSIREELLAIKDASDDGMLHAGEVVDWARENAASALHKHFIWDDARAAEEHRLDRARNLIRLHVVTEDGAPQLVSLSFDRTKGGGYRNVSDVLASKDLSEVMLRDALAELERVRVRYERVEQLTAVWRQVETIRQRHTRRAARKPVSADKPTALAS